MAKLKTATRKNLPKSDFGDPGKRAYPMEDRAHAKDAKARASEAVGDGRMSRGTEAKIDAKANKKLGEKGSAPRAGATDGMGAGKGALAIHSSARGTNMHSDSSMHRERY